MCSEEMEKVTKKREGRRGVARAKVSCKEYAVSTSSHDHNKNNEDDVCSCEACDDADCTWCCPERLAALNPLLRLILFVIGMLCVILILGNYQLN